MHRRSIHRATSIALASLLAFAGIASADSVQADGDAVTAGAQASIDLGRVAPSEEITVSIGFILTCANLGHVDPGQTVTLSLGSATVPLDGGIVADVAGTVGPMPDVWTGDGEGCPDPAPTVTAGTPGSLTIRAPSLPGTGYVFATLWDRTLAPAGSDDGDAFGRSATGFSITLEVVGNTPPVLTVPGDLTVEGDAVGGWTAAYTVSATDAEDATDPAPICSPAPASLLPLGVTTVACIATDGGGLTDAASFDVTVVDTTAPVLAGMPVARAVEAATSEGAVVTWTDPIATDIVDPAPAVACLPSSGSTFPVGTTTVICAAVDASKNAAFASFEVTVSGASDPVASATWHAPLPAVGGTFLANRGRTIPVKVVVRTDGVARMVGDVTLALEPCVGGPAATTLPLHFSGGRWNGLLDTSGLDAACYDARVEIDGLDAGGFRLALRGPEAAGGKADRRPR